jgi:hypothetical protein
VGIGNGILGLCADELGVRHAVDFVAGLEICDACADCFHDT